MGKYTGKTKYSHAHTSTGTENQDAHAATPSGTDTLYAAHAPDGTSCQEASPMQ